MDAATERALTEVEHCLARYQRRLSRVLDAMRGYAVTEAELSDLGRDSRLFTTAAERLYRALGDSERDAIGRLRTAKSGARVWHQTIGRYAEAMRTLLAGTGTPEDDRVAEEFIERARVRRRFAQAAETRAVRLRALDGALRRLRRRHGGGGPRSDGAPPNRTIGD